ncbi:MAG: CRISPR-associated helicase Cas3' [Candidatus Caldarchaeum sp.]
MREVGESCRRRLEELGITDEIMLKAVEIIGKTHDFAKYSRFFQDSLRKGEKYNRELASHAPLSALYGSWVVNRLINDPFITTASMLCIYNHHRSLGGRLDSLRELLDNILNNNNYRKQLESIMRDADRISAELKELSLPHIKDFYEDFRTGMRNLAKSLVQAARRTAHDFGDFYKILLFFSVLLDSDKRLAAGLGPVHRIDIDANIVDRYRSLKFSDRRGVMAEIRNKIYEDAMNSLGDILRRPQLPRIVTVTAPTGGGKTLLGLSTALKLRAEVQKRTGVSPRIIYVLPYINIIEQTHDVFHDVLSNEYGDVPISLLLKHHHLYIPVSKISEDKTLDDLLLLVESWDSEIIVTTFVQLFETLLGTRNNMLKKFHKLHNSIIIVDEAQTLPVEYWRLVNEALSNLVKNSNSYVLFMTATQPFVFRQSEELVKHSREHFSKLDRTKYTYVPTNMHVEEAADFIVEIWCQDVSMLAVVNTISTSIKLYTAIKRRLENDNVVLLGAGEEGLYDRNRPVLCYLSTNIIPKERFRRISILKNLLHSRRRILVISTQLVEAGVDLDFDKVVRDIGPIDSVIQVGGRCNREWVKDKGEVFIIQIVNEEGKPDSTKIYGSLTINDIAKSLLSKWKNFSEADIITLLNAYNELIFEKLQVETQDESKEILRAVENFDFDRLSRFRLIEEEPKTAVFVEINHEARHVLKEFVDLWSKRHKAETDPYELRAHIRRQRTKLDEYIIETWATEGLPPKRIVEDLEIRYVPLSEVEAYYDKETGFRRASELQASIW